ncbi:hypothetical protein GCM10027347_60790 [Larkinella harenae]
MLLLFSVRQTDGDIRSLVFYSQNFEDGWDVLNRLMKSGYTVLSAVIREPGGKQTSLPVELLDGEPIAKYLRLLQYEWEQILEN